jgi:hypothetical protein
MVIRRKQQLMKHKYKQAGVLLAGINAIQGLGIIQINKKGNKRNMNKYNLPYQWLGVNMYGSGQWQAGMYGF